MPPVNLRLLDKDAAKDKDIAKDRVTGRDSTMNRQKALDDAVGQIERALGKGSVMKLGARVAAAGEAEVVSTGSLGLDIALGIGGLARGPGGGGYRAQSTGPTTRA